MVYGGSRVDRRNTFKPPTKINDNNEVVVLCLSVGPIILATEHAPAVMTATMVFNFGNQIVRNCHK